MTTPLHDRAIYFLGNDYVLNFGLAAFASFRAHNPSLPAFLIPFNDQLTEMEEVCARYRITILKDPSMMQFKLMEEEFWDEKHRDHAMAYKFYTFNGPAKTFLFSDCDVVFLENLDHLFDLFEGGGMDFISFEPSIDYVYKNGPLREELVAKNITRGFNAGVFMSRRGLISAEGITSFFAANKAVRNEFSDRRDQSLFNYLVDSHRWRHLNIAELAPEYSPSNNARLRPIRQIGGHWRVNNIHIQQHGKRIAMLHWNGLKLPGLLPNMRQFLRYRKASIPAPLFPGYLIRNLWAGKIELLRRVQERAQRLINGLSRRLKRKTGKANLQPTR